MPEAFEPLPYTDGDTALTGLIARPAARPRAAVIVFPTIMNQSPNALRRLPMLAEQGYLAFCADFYGRAPADRADAHALGTALRQDVAAYRARIKAAVDTLAAIAQKLPELPADARVLGFNYDTGERYLSVPDFLPE